MTPLPLDILITPDYSHRVIMLDVLFNWLVSRLATSGYLLLGEFIQVWNLYAWYTGEWVHPQNPGVALTLHVAFLMDYSATLVHTSTVAHMEFLVIFVKGNYECFWSIHGGVFSYPLTFHLRPWVPFVPIPLGFHKPLIQKLTHTPPVFPMA